MKTKVCGMKYRDNILSVASLQPDYLGFIFYQRSKRHFVGVLPELEPAIKKTGVFVNEELATLSATVRKYGLNAIQLHGDETVDFCRALKKEFNDDIELIKAFSMADDFNFDKLNPYDEVCDYFLFDTKGKERGGNGTLFDWTLLNDYHHTKRFFLSGGIGLKEAAILKQFLNSRAGQYCYAIDLNSKFESEPGLKNREELEEFFKQIEKHK
jgi:phosphoribosylanthranilate isomerase